MIKNVIISIINLCDFCSNGPWFRSVSVKTGNRNELGIKFFYERKATTSKNNCYQRIWTNKNSLPSLLGLRYGNFVGSPQTGQYLVKLMFHEMFLWSFCLMCRDACCFMYFLVKYGSNFTINSSLLTGKWLIHDNVYSRVSNCTLVCQNMDRDTYVFGPWIDIS